MANLSITGDPLADALLSEDPFALLAGMALDQQFPMERAFAGPATIRERLGTLDPRTIASTDPEEFASLCAQTPAVHRFPGSMAGRLQELASYVVEHHDGDASRIWTEARDGKDLLARVQVLPGFGKQKATIFVALLGKQVGVDVPGWREAVGAYGEEGYRSVADVVDVESLERVRAYKKEQKAAAKAARS